MESNSGFFKKLWSSKSSSRPQPTLSSSKSPSFNPSSFGSQSGTTASKTGSPSSFYAGRVRYGGAMSASRNNLSSPYVVPNITKAKERSSNLDEGRSSMVGNKKLSGTLSSTARKIFQALEKMSTPLRDMKKIPPPSIKISSSFGRPQRKRSIGTTLLESSKRSCPPSRGITISSQVPQSSTPSLPLDNSLATQSILKNISGESSPSHVVYKGQPAVMASLSSSIGMKKFGGGVAGGKMRNPRKTADHYSTVVGNDESDSPDIPDLPDIPISISTLPKFDFGNPESTSTPALGKSSISKVVSSATKSRVFSEPLYAFSPPTAVSSSRRHMMSDGNTSEKFKFSSPVSSKQKLNSDTSRKSNSENFSTKNQLQLQANEGLKQKSAPALKMHGSVMDVLGKPSNSVNGTEKKKKTDKVSFKAPTSFLAEIFQSSDDMWECETCMVKNSKDVAKCVSCQSDKPRQKQLSAENISNSWTCYVCLVKNEDTRMTCKACSSARPSDASTKPHQVESNLSKWECEVCMIKNDNNRTNCEACNAPKPGNKPPTKPSGSGSSKWQCDTCLLYNDSNVRKCVACEAPKPGSTVSMSLPENPSTKLFSGNLASLSSTSTAQNFVFGAATKEKSALAENANDKWTCDTCLVQNDQSDTTCVACKSAKPGYKSASKETQQSSSSFKVGFGKLSSDSKWECQVCLVPNDSERVRCIACDSPKPGSETVESNNSQKSSSFKFGSTSTSVLQFGIPSKATKTSTDLTPNPPSTLGASTSGSVQSGFKFGTTVSSSADKGVASSVSFSPVSTSQKVATSVPFNFGGKVTSTTSVQNTAPKPTFSFGATSQTKAAESHPAIAKSSTVDSLKTQGVKSGFLFGAQPQSETRSQPTIGKPVSENSLESKAPKLPFSFGVKSPSKVQFGATQSLPTIGKPNFVDSSSKTDAPKQTFSFGAKPQSEASSQQAVSSALFSFGTNAASSSSGALSTSTPPSSSFGFSAPKLGEKDTSSSTLQQSTDSGSVIKSMLMSQQLAPFGSAESSNIAPTNAAQLSTTEQKVSSSLSTATPAKPTSGFQFQASQTKQPSSSFSFGAKPAQSGFPQAPAFGSNLTSNVASQGFSKPSEQKSTFSTLGQQKIGENPVQSGFAGFGAQQSDKSAFGKDVSSLPKPSFNFGSTKASSSSQQTGSTNMFGSNMTPTQSGGLMFGSGSSSNLPQSQNPPSFGTSQPAAQQPFSFGAAATEQPKPSNTFQFGASQSSQPAQGQSGFSFGSAQNQTNNPAPSAGFNFSAAAQNTAKPMFSSTPASGFQFGAGGQNQQQVQSKADSTSGFAFAAGQPPAFGQSMPASNPGGSMFSIGQGTTQGRSSTPVRQMKQARRRLKPFNKN